VVDVDQHARVTQDQLVAKPCVVVLDVVIGAHLQLEMDTAIDLHVKGRSIRTPERGV